MIKTVFKIIQLGFEQAKDMVCNSLRTVWVKFIFTFVCFWLFTLSIIFFSFAAALAIDEWLQTTYCGFLIMGGLYFLLTVVVYIIYKIAMYFIEN